MAKPSYKQKQSTGNKWGFSAVDNSPYHKMYNGRNYYNQQEFGIDTQYALMDYINPNPLQGSLYSIAQTLNHAMKTGATLDNNQKEMVDSINEGMHNLGENAELTRYARVDFVSRLGLNNYWDYTEEQLQAIFVGQTFTENGFISCSYNDFKNAPNGGAPFTDKAVKINYNAPAATQALMAPMGGGGNLGEIVMAPNQSYTITGVHLTGATGRSGANSYPQIEFDIKVNA